MASTNPVPSRAAINALRGVILTTSCSVILVAEERRRRIKIARAAIDNARKLHTVRVNHGPALSESIGYHETLPIEFANAPQKLLLPEQKSSFRRRRKDGKLSQRSRPQELKESKEPLTSPEPVSQVSSTPQARRDAWDEWQAARKEASRIPGPTPFAHNDLFLRLPTDYEKVMPPLTEQEIPSTTKKTTPHSAEQEWDALGKASPFAHNDLFLRMSTDYEEVIPPLTEQDFPPLTEEERAERIDREAESASSPTTAQSKKQANAEDVCSKEDMLLESSARLRQLMTDLIPQPDKTVDHVKELGSAIQLLATLASVQFITRETVFSDSLALLKASVETEQYVWIPSILEAAHPAGLNIAALLASFIDFLHQENNTKAMRRMLAHPTCVRIQRFISPDKVRTSWISGLFADKWRRTKDFAAVMGLYAFIQNSGLFVEVGHPNLAPYTIRRRIAVIALEAGEDTIASEEIAHLRTLLPKALEKDFVLKTRSIMQDAVRGRWDWVQKGLSALSRLRQSKEGQYQATLANLTKLYAREHCPEDVDEFVRSLVGDHGMTLNQPLALIVMDRHGRNRDIAALSNWLRYCQDSGLEIDQQFLNKMAEKCWKYWNFGQQEFSALCRSLKARFPLLHTPRVTKYSQHGPLSVLKAQKSRRDSSERADSALNLPKKAGMPKAMFEQTAFKCMNSQALQNDWDQVKVTYNEASEKGLGFSPRCLRLAVIANIKKEGGQSEAAVDLVLKAHEEGHDVSEALVPLLVAQLECGYNPERLINETLRNGAWIHDSVYNKAARLLAQKGRHEVAINMCKLAAQENGNGDPAYSKFNFANLISFCTKLEWYRDLNLLVESFVSKSSYWHGSKECKESIKLAMKTVALRANPASNQQGIHEEALMSLDKALKHVKECRSTIRNDRKALQEELVDAFKPEPLIDEVAAVELVEAEEAQSMQSSSVENNAVEKDTRVEPEQLSNMDFKLAVHMQVMADAALAEDVQVEETTRPRERVRDDSKASTANRFDAFEEQVQVHRRDFAEDLNAPRLAAGAW